MTVKRTWIVALGFLLVVGPWVSPSVRAQNLIKDGQPVSPDAPKLTLVHAPDLILPGQSLPIYVSAKAGEADLRELVWSFSNPPYSDISFGSYGVKAGEERGVTGHFILSTFDAIRAGIGISENTYVYIRIWARDVNDRSGPAASFSVTLNSLGPKTFDPPDSTTDFSKRLGVIEGRIVPPVSDASEAPAN